MWILVIFFALIAYILQNYYWTIRGFFFARNIPGPTSYPIIGSAHHFIGKTRAEIFQTIMSWSNRYGSFSKVWIGLELKFIVQDPKDIEIIMSGTQYLNKTSDYYLLRPWFHDGVFLSTGKKWHDRRRTTAPAFHFQMVEKFTETFDRLGNAYIDKLSECSENNEDIEFFNLNRLHALNVVCETAMGVSLNALSKPNSAYLRANTDLQNVFNMRVYNWTLRQPWLYKWTNLQKVEANALHVWHGFTADVIRKRRQELINAKMNDDLNKDTTTNADDLGIRKKRALCDILLNSTVDGKPLSDQDIHEEVNTYISAGYSTTASALTFCLYNIAKYPEVQQKCFNEIVEVYGTNVNQPATFSLLNQLFYLEMTIKETLRLYTPATVIARRATEDIKLTNNRIVPKGSDVVIPFYTIFRDPLYYENALQFMPERFSIEKSVEKKNQYTYMPFSAGPRNCPGQKFATTEMKCILSKIVHNFEILLTKGSEVEPTVSSPIVMRPESPIIFNLKRRA